MSADRPTCFWCIWNERSAPEIFIRPADAVFESVCGHDECPTLTFHGLCLMEFRDDEHFHYARERNNALIRWLRGDHGEG